MEARENMTAPYLPLEIQYQILESADWLQQPTLRQVCKAWESFIDKSSKLFGDRYTEWPAPAGLELGPQLHRVVGYRNGFKFAGSLKDGFKPCILHRDDTGKVTGSSPETDLSLYLADPLLKPDTVVRVQGLLAIVKGIGGRNEFYAAWTLRDITTVDSYLQNTYNKLRQVLDTAYHRSSNPEISNYYSIWLSVTRMSSDDVAGLSLIVQPEREADRVQAQN